jgi:hypothetical protein
VSLQKQPFPPKDSHGRPRTAWAVYCLYGPFGRGCGLVYLTEKEYSQQLDNPDARWKCPLCGYEAVWSDENYYQCEDAVSDNR